VEDFDKFVDNSQICKYCAEKLPLQNLLLKFREAANDDSLTGEENVTSETFFAL